MTDSSNITGRLGVSPRIATRPPALNTRYGPAPPKMFPALPKMPGLSGANGDLARMFKQDFRKTCLISVPNSEQKIAERELYNQRLQAVYGGKAQAVVGKKLSYAPVAVSTTPKKACNRVCGLRSLRADHENRPTKTKHVPENIIIG